MIALGTRGPDTPAWVEKALSRFGRTPAGGNIYRVIWSERKLLALDGELVPEYDTKQWVIEKWLSPEEYAGSEILHAMNSEAQRLGPYPRDGYYMEVSPQPFVPGVELSRDVLALLCTLIERGKAFTATERAAALRDREQRKKAEEAAKLLLAAQEVQDSASQGRTQQAVSGPLNKFRTADDWERDQGSLTTQDISMPAQAGLAQY